MAVNLSLCVCLICGLRRKFVFQKRLASTNQLLRCAGFGFGPEQMRLLQRYPARTIHLAGKPKLCFGDPCQIPQHQHIFLFKIIGMNGGQTLHLQTKFLVDFPPAAFLCGFTGFQITGYAYIPFYIDIILPKQGRFPLLIYRQCNNADGRLVKHWLFANITVIHEAFVTDFPLHKQSAAFRAMDKFHVRCRSFSRFLN